MATRAIHIEVSHSMTTDSFIAALRRFQARRGAIKRIKSDNGTNFHGADRELKEAISQWNMQKLDCHLKQNSIEWSFNPPYASHFGGVWERMIRTVRNVLNAIVKEQHSKLTCEEFTTFMCEVEAIINNRPITEVSGDHNDLRALTPNHILLLNSGITFPPGLFSEDESYSKRRWKQIQFLAELFWKRFRKEYLPLLQERQKWNSEKRSLEVGDLVLVVDVLLPRNQWCLGRVTETIADVHNHVRAAKVKVVKYKNSSLNTYGTTVFNRPICIGLIAAMFLPYAAMFFFWTSEKSTIDYCKLAADHLLCKPDNVSDACKKIKPTYYKVIPVSNEMKKKIVKFHNILRKRVANASVTGMNDELFPSASNIREIVWSNLLALAAQKMAQRCNLYAGTTDLQRKFPFFGEDGLLGEIFYQEQNGQIDEPVANWTQIFDQYFDFERKYYPISKIDRHQPDRRIHGKDIRTTYFSQIAWAQTYLIGCASYGFQSFIGKSIVATCMYGPAGNVVGQPMYLRGTPCTECDGASCSDAYPGLCSSKKLPQPGRKDFPAGFEHLSSAPLTKEKFWYLIVAFGSVVILA